MCFIRLCVFCWVYVFLSGFYGVLKFVCVCFYWVMGFGCSGNGSGCSGIGPRGDIASLELDLAALGVGLASLGLDVAALGLDLDQ